MPESVTRDIRFKSQKNGTLTDAKMHLTSFSEHEQKVRSIKSLLGLWGIGAICILIPVAHFILVPAFLVGGVVVASRRWKTAEEGLDAEGVCPACSNNIQIPLEKNAELPQWHDCPQCGDPLELRE